MNQFYKLINNPILNTDNTIRYSLLYQSKPESLAHHITDVSTLSYLLALQLIHECDEELNVGLLLEKVLVHDFDEVLTGDIPRTTKYYSEEGLTALREVASDAMKVLASTVPGGARLEDTWKSAKQGKEGMILEVSDMICVSRKVVTEFSMLGNGYFLKVAYEMGRNLDELRNELDDPSTDFSLFNKSSIRVLKGLLRDARMAMADICSDDRLIKNGVVNNVFNKYNKPE